MSSKNVNNIDVCIIGGGVSGLFLASKFASSELNVSIIESSNSVGGQVNLYREKYIYNIPLIEKIKGKDTCNHLLNIVQQKQNIAISLDTTLQSIKKINNEKFKLHIYNGKNKSYEEIICKYIVLAFGKGENTPNKLPMSNADKFEGKSLFYNVDNKNLFAGKNVVITGGGDSAIDWVVELKDIAKSIKVVHRRSIENSENDQFDIFKAVFEKKNNTMKTPYIITELIGDEKKGLIKEIKISNVETHSEERIKCDYLLVFYGLRMTKSTFLENSKLAVNFDNSGVYVDRHTNETDEQNIFAIGDCCSDNKIKNIQISFTNATKCFYEISNREKKKD